MSTLQFPANPAIGDTYDWDAYKYVWDGEKWKTVGIGYNPVNDLRDELEPRISNNESKVLEALRRSYAGAGYNLVDGSFEMGGTIASASDVLLYEATGVAYSYSGTLPKAVPAGSSPATTGGFGEDNWIAARYQDHATLGNRNAAGAHDSNAISHGIRTVFQKLTDIISVKDFGAVGDGLVDDTAAIQAAADYMQQGMCLEFFEGTFKITSTVILKAVSNTTYNFGNAKLLYPSINGTAFTLQNSAVNRSLAGDVQVGDGSLKLSDTTNISKGQLIAIGNDKEWFVQDVGAIRRNKKGELLVVDSVVSTSEVALWGGGCLFAYPTTENNPYVLVYDNVENITFKGGHFIGPGAQAATDYIRVVGVRNLQFLNMAVSSVNVGLGFAYCSEVHVCGCNFREIALAGLGYAVNIGTFNLDVVVTNCTGNRGRHFVTTTGEDGVTKGILITGNIFSGSINKAIDTHAQGWNTHIVGNVISDSFGGIQVRSPNSVISGNKILDCTEPENKAILSTRSSCSGILVTEMGHINLVIENNTVTNTTRFANMHGLRGSKFAIFGTALDVRVSPNLAGYTEFNNDFVVIKGNTLQGFTNGSNIAFAGNGATSAQGNHPRRLYVEGNLCGKSGYNNISITGSSDSVLLMEVFIRNNVLDTSIRGSGHLAISGVKFVVMEGNTFPEGAQPAVNISNTQWVTIRDTKLHVATNVAEYGFEPVLTNVTGSSVERWGTGFNSKVINVVGAAAYTLTISALNGAYVNQWAVSSIGVNKLSDTSSSTVTAVAGAITITQTGSFLWHLRPASPFVLNN